MMNRRTIPFEIPDVNHGFVEVKGLLHVNSNELVLEFDERDAFMGVIKSDLKEVRIPFSDIEAIEVKKRFFSMRAEIISTSMRTLQDVPGADQGRVKMKIRRKNRDEAERVFSKARLALSEYKLNEMEE